MTTDRSRARVDGWLETLRDRHGSFERVENRWRLDADGAVLLVRDEGDESFAAAARRVEAGTGVDCRLTGVREAHVLAITCETDPERPTLCSLIVVFAGTDPEGAPAPARARPPRSAGSTRRPRRCSTRRWPSDRIPRASDSRARPPDAGRPVRSTAVGR